MKFQPVLQQLFDHFPMLFPKPPAAAAKKKFDQDREDEGNGLQDTTTANGEGSHNEASPPDSPVKLPGSPSAKEE